MEIFTSIIQTPTLQYIKLLHAIICLLLCLNLCSMQQCEEHQSSVITGHKRHALYFTAKVKWNEDLKVLAKKAAELSFFIEDLSSKDDDVLGGVGFGENFYNKVSNKTRSFKYYTRKGSHGSMPATEGDIFVHAKSDCMSKLFELTQRLLKELGRSNLESFEDVYGFMYKDSRDLSGFIDGTENPATPEHRHQVAVDCQHGGSFVLTQRWVHDMEYIEKMNDKTLEEIIGRTKKDSIELEPLPVDSHVARMTKDDTRPTAFEIVRQSLPYGTLSSDAGLFFISYANHTRNMDFMLDNMVGKSNGKHNDTVMMISKAVTGNYWFFPGVKELQEMRNL